MDQLLDEVDSLQHPDLSDLTGNWCESCESLRQEVKRLQDDQVQNFSKLKQKIISTDLLIKKYKSKCDDYDIQSKRLEDVTRRQEKAQRQSETLELQLKSSLLETEPLRKSKQNLEVELRLKTAALEDTNNKLVCAQGLHQQIQGENKYLQEQIDKLNEEKLSLKEKINWYKRTERDEDTVKQLKADLANAKREVSRLQKENGKLQKKERTLEIKLQDTTEKMNHYSNMLKQHKLMTAARKSLPHLRSPGKSNATSDSDISVAGKDSFLHKEVKESVTDTESSEDDNDSLFQIPWTFTPLATCLSPLPPSPACFSQNQTATAQDDDDDDDDDEYLSDLAEELEHQLMDILSEDEITDVDSTGKKDSQRTEETLEEFINNAYSNDAVDKCENLNDNTEILGNDAHVAVDYESVCRNIVDDIVNEIVDDNDTGRETQEDVTQTVYCDDTTLIKTQHSKLESDNSGSTEIQVEHNTVSIKQTRNNELDLNDLCMSPDSETFKSPKSLKERLKDSAQIISPVSTKQKRSYDKTSHPTHSNHSESKMPVISESVSNIVKPYALSDIVSDNGSEESTNLSRCNTGEFTPFLNEIESPSFISKEEKNFFTIGDESTCVHSIKTLNLPENKEEIKNTDKTVVDNNSVNLHEDGGKDMTNAKRTKTKTGTSFLKDSQQKPYLKRQMALRKDSASDMVHGKKVCTESSKEITRTVPTTGNKRLTRSKSVPNKWINFQKGACETLAEEMAENDVSRGSYESGACHSNTQKELKVNNKTETHNEKSDSDFDKTILNDMDNKKDKLLKENDGTEKFSPIARRTRRSSKLQSISENRTDLENLKKAPSDKSESKVLNSEEDEKGVASEDNKDRVQVKFEENKVEAPKETEKTENKILECAKDTISESGSCIQKQDGSAISEIDFRGDSHRPDVRDTKGDPQKSCIINNKKTSETQLDEHIKGDTHNSSPDSDEANSKITPSRQLSTGFLLQSPTRNVTDNLHHSPVRLLKEVLVEEDENTTSAASVSDVPSVILDVNDIFSDKTSVVEENGNVTDKAKIDVEDHTTKDIPKSDSSALLEPVEKQLHTDNDSIDEPQKTNISLLEDVKGLSNVSDSPLSVSPDAEEIGENESDRSLSVPWSDSGSTCDNKFIESRSGSATPDHVSVNYSAVLSPLPMSPFELVDLISPLPPSPVFSDEVVSPLSECCEDETTVVEEIKSPETSENLQNLPEICSPENKPLIDKEKLEFSPLPAMLSPIYTPKKVVSSVKKLTAKDRVRETASKPCKFISDVPKGVINVKPKAAQMADQADTLNTAQEPVKDSVVLEKDTSESNSDVLKKSNPEVVDKLQNNPKLLKSSHGTTLNAKETQPKSSIKEAKEKCEGTANFVNGLQLEKQDSLITQGEKTHGTLDTVQTESKPAGGYDNLVASKTKSRQAHQPKQPRLPVKKPVPIIEAPVMVPVNRKRKSLDQEKEVEEKKPCKEQVFKRRQKSESKTKSAENKLMQSFLKSSDAPETIIAKFDVEGSEESAEYKAVTTCFECLSRIRNDTLDAVHESCMTDDYLNIIEDWPYMFPVEKQAIELCWQSIHGDKQTLTREQVMAELWKRIFDSEHGTSISGKKSLCRLFTALCLKAGNIEIVRVLYYHVVVCGYMQVTSFLVPIISVWPEVLRREDDGDHGMVIVLKYLVMQMLKSQENEISKKIKDCAVKLCNWTEEQDSADNILVKLIKKLQETSAEDSSAASQAFELSKSIELLSMKEGWPWFYQSFVGRHCLQTVSNKWQAKGRNCGLTSRYVCTVLKIAATVLCHFSSAKSRQFADTIRHWILPILRKEPSCPQVRECCIETLLELSCITPKVLCNLQGWYFMFKGTIRPDLVTRMEAMRQEYSTKFGLICDPITRKFPPKETEVNPKKR